MPREQKPNQIQVSFLIDKEEHKKVKAKADGLGMSLASYFKFTALNANVEVKISRCKDE